MSFIEYEEWILSGQTAGNVKVSEDVLSEYSKARQLMQDMVSETSLGSFNCVKQALGITSTPWGA